MRRATWRLAAFSVVLVAAGACERASDDEARSADTGAAVATTTEVSPAEYTVVLKSAWTAANHPFEYPSAGVVSGPHFSGLIGTAHNPSYSIFTEGTPPTRGLERLSEEGRHSPLDEEIRAAISAGNAAVLVESGPLRDFNDSLVADVRVDQAHPLVSLVAMIAPSPDWFTGVRNVNLMENGAWVSSRTVELFAYDSGGDDGTTYKAPDRDTSPKKPTTQAMTRHFTRDGVAVPVGAVTFTRK